MKKHLLFLLIVFIAVSAHGQNPIPNGNFEQWTSGTFDYPLNYPFTSNYQAFYTFHVPFNVTKSTDAYHGNYAVKMITNATSIDTVPGSIWNENPDAKKPRTGAMPYNQKPTGIRGYYKYNGSSTDSVNIMVLFSKNGNTLEGENFYRLGGVHDTYTLFNITFNPPLVETPDSVSFAAASSFVKGDGTIVTGSTLLLDSVSFTGVSSQPAMMNGDFELWDNRTLSKPNNWEKDGYDFEFSNRTTDAVKGNYALELKTYVKKTNSAKAGLVSTGYYPSNCDHDGCQEQGGFPFSEQIDTLAFYYKYVPSGIDTAYIELNFKKNGNSIHWDTINLIASQSYTYFEFPINMNLAPDTVIINIGSSIQNDIPMSCVGSDLKIDEIHFKSQTISTGINTLTSDLGDEIGIFPNPSNGKFQIKSLSATIKELEIYDVLGKVIYSNAQFNQIKSGEIDVSKSNKGIYFVKIFDGMKFYTKKVLIE
jgi:hypothetical protein